MFVIAERFMDPRAMTFEIFRTSQCYAVIFRPTYMM